VIRPATDADRPALRRLQAALERPNPDLLDRHLAGLGVVLVAERDGAVAGYVAGFLGTERAHATEVAVAPAHRRAGVATALFEAYFERAAAAGADRVTLAVAPDNEAAIACYRGLGFERDRRDEAYFDGDPGLVMARDLADD